jgi:NAD(P)-dependent dehydrogenase (short-subunit alcohol dehydrogenase family)
LCDISEAYFDDQFDTNVKGLVFTLHALLPLMHQGSSIVINASTLAGKAVAGMAVYAATKGALVSLARTLAVELAPRGIRVNSLSPGITATEGLGKAGVPPEAAVGLTAQQPVARPAQPDEIAATALFLCSAEARFITGSDFVVDGGYAA